MGSKGEAPGFRGKGLRINLTIVFHGKRLQINLREKLEYDKRVVVVYQENAWCDEKVMAAWIRHQWKPFCEGNMLLITDVHRAQKTEAILILLRNQCNTEVEFVPPGTTSLVQLIL